MRGMTEKEKGEKYEELKLELIKARVNSAKTGHAKIREIKKLIAKILTLKKGEKIK